MALKEYNYYYENGALVRSVEFDITLDSNEFVTSKTQNFSTVYSYDSEGTLERKVVTSQNGLNQIFYYEKSEKGDGTIKLKSIEKELLCKRKRGQKMKKWILVVAAGVILLSSLLAVVYYSFAFVKLNDCIVFVNKNGVQESEESDGISNSQIKQFQIVEDEFIEENFYIQIKTRKKITNLSVSKISFLCDITVTVKDWESFDEVKVYNQKQETNFYFEDFKWKVDSVKVV